MELCWLLSLPQETLGYFRSLIEDTDPHSLLATSDPDGQNVGSGGAVCHLLEHFAKESEGSERTIIINAGGESRRLPAYSGYGKTLLPVPVMKWSRGQRVDQRLLHLQQEYLARIARVAPHSLHTIVASGDAYIELPPYLPPMPEADVVCLGLWSSAEVATRHGVFVTERAEPWRLVKMLQKPTAEELAKEGEEHLLLVDSGVWLLSDRALAVLKEQVVRQSSGFYDLYTHFGALLGRDTTSTLSVAIWVVDEARFYHFGSSAELISSTYALQNRILDQREWLSARWKKHGTIFAQNALVEFSFTPRNQNIWVENSHVPATWQLSGNHIITGVPHNNWHLTLPEGICLDIVPLHHKRNGYAVRLYHYHDTFKGPYWLGRKVATAEGGDIYDVPLFPVVEHLEQVPNVVVELLAGSYQYREGQALSGRELLTSTHFGTLEKQRRAFLESNLEAMRHNPRSVFYQTDLHRTAQIMVTEPQPISTPLRGHLKIHEEAFRREWYHQRGIEQPRGTALAELLYGASAPQLLSRPTALYPDQIVWARSPVRIDVAGGWTDTPPYCLYEGGAVVNFSLLLNGLEPLQAYVKRSPSGSVVLRSIDLGATEVVERTEVLFQFSHPGSPFAIPKAALVLCGVAQVGEPWQKVLERMGGGVEITLLSALPAGSGLGTSSILATTLLGALSHYFNLNWSREQLAEKTLVLEQMLTTGGGWQDQYGGLYGGVKWIQSERGLPQHPRVEWLPSNLFTQPKLAPLHLLFYTGQTRLAKGVLDNIVDKVLLNSGNTLAELADIKALAHQMANAIAVANIEEYGQLLRASWQANKRLDAGSSTPMVEHIISLIDDYALGYKLAGAGGGGFLYIVAKDEVATNRIRERLTQQTAQLPSSARLAQMQLAEQGLQVTRS